MSEFIKVNPLSLGTVFKKGFSDVAIFTQMVKDFTGVNLKIKEVENEKAFVKSIADVATKFDLFAEDKENRVIVEAQHANYSDNFDRFFYYHQIATVETVVSSKNYRFPQTIYTLVFFTNRNSPAEGKNILVHDAQMRYIVDDEVINGVVSRQHRLFFIFTKSPDSDTRISDECREWIKAIHETLTGSVQKTDYQNQEIKRLFERIAADKTTPEERFRMKEEYNQEEVKKEAKNEGFQEGKEEGLQEGKEEGIKEGVEQTARNFKALGTLTDEQIAQATGLTVETVKTL